MDNNMYGGIYTVYMYITRPCTLYVVHSLIKGRVRERERGQRVRAREGVCVYCPLTSMVRGRSVKRKRRLRSRLREKWLMY